MTPPPAPTTPPKPRLAPVVVLIPALLLEQIGNYLGTLPYKVVHQLRPSLSSVLINQPGKDTLHIDKVLLDTTLSVLVDQPYDQVCEIMRLIDSWIAYVTAQNALIETKDPIN